MSQFLLRRSLDALSALIGVTLFTFILFQVAGGDPASQMAGIHATSDQIESLRNQLGTNLPLHIQYFKYLKELAVLDFGESWSTKQNVSDILFESVGPSISLAFPAFTFATLFSMLLALTLNLKRGRRWDRHVLILIYSGMSVSFLIIILFFQYVFAYKFGLFPISGWDNGYLERWRFLALPIFIYFLVLVPPNFLIYRSLIFEENSQNYLRTAQAKGLSEVQITSSHLLKNLLLPVITLVSFQLPFLFTGAILLESFFGIPGVGGQLYGALSNADLPVIKGITVFSSSLYILFNTLGDFLYTLFDPRVELQ